ncbi:MAG TPA: ATP-grasp domain-containing protein [Bacteroidota bacterium]|nr:ATP-grasp domain-containing protein [Bacteroidota bacterium]
MPYALVVGDIDLVRSVGQAGIPLFVCSHYEENIGFHSRYCRRPVHVARTSSEGFARDLIEFGKAHGEKIVFFSDDDRAVMNFSEHREELGKYYYYNLPEHSMVKAVLDKREFATLARERNIPAPVMFTPSSLEELQKIIDKIPFPCVIKPANKHDWWHPKFHEIVGPYQKAIRCDSKDELIHWYKKVVQINNDIIVQEYVAGNDAHLYSINMYFNRKQEMLAYFIGHKLRIFPIHAGVATLAVTVDDPGIRDLAVDIARKLNITGHLNIQFKQDPDTKALKVLEIHARNSTWCHLSTAAGRNITGIAYYDMIGQKCPLPDRYETGVKWLDISKDVKAFLAYRRAGEMTLGAWLSSLRGPTVHHLWSLQDPKPALMETWYIMRRRFRRKIVSGAAPQE